LPAAFGFANSRIGIRDSSRTDPWVRAGIVQGYKERRVCGDEGVLLGAGDDFGRDPLVARQEQSAAGGAGEQVAALAGGELEGLADTLDRLRRLAQKRLRGDIADDSVPSSDPRSSASLGDRSQPAPALARALGQLVQEPGPAWFAHQQPGFVDEHAASARGPSSWRQIASSASSNAGAFSRSGRPRREKQTSGPSGRRRPGKQLSLHVEPLSPSIAAGRLRRQRARVESTRRFERECGQLTDPTVAAAAEDADELAARSARGESRLFRSGLYLTIRGHSPEELDARSQRVRALCAFAPSTHGADKLPRPRRLRSADCRSDWIGSACAAFDTEALAASFPFAAVDPPAEQSRALYGLSPSGAPVLLASRTRITTASSSHRSGAG
jgi:hypothetical protein